MVCLETWQHIDYEFGIDLILRVLIAFLVQTVSLIFIFLIGLSLNDDTLNLELIDFLLVQIGLIEVYYGQIFIVEWGVRSGVEVTDCTLKSVQVIEVFVR